MRSDDDLSAALTPELCEGARAWLAAPAKRITKAESTTTLFVLEGSWAAVPRDSAHLEWIGTDDATTCHCIALVSPTHVAVSHLNDAAPAEQNLRDMVEAVKEGAPVPVTAPIELWVAGGMGGAGVPADVTQLSLETSAAVLEALETVRRASRGEQRCPLSPPRSTRVLPPHRRARRFCRCARGAAPRVHRPPQRHSRRRLPRLPRPLCQPAKRCGRACGFR